MSFINSFNIWYKTSGYGIEFTSIQTNETDDIDTKIQNLKFKTPYFGSSIVSSLRKFAVTFPYVIGVPFVGFAGAIYHLAQGILFGCKSLHGYFKKIDKQDYDALIKKTQKAFGLALYDFSFSFFFGVLTAPSQEEDFDLFFKKIGLGSLSQDEKYTLTHRVKNIISKLPSDDLTDPEKNGLLFPDETCRIGITSAKAIESFVNKIKEFKSNHLDFVSRKVVQISFLKRKFSFGFESRKNGQLHKLIEAFDLIEWDKVGENSKAEVIKQRLINWKLLALINYCGEGFNNNKQDSVLQLIKNRNHLYNLAG